MLLASYNFTDSKCLLLFITVYFLYSLSSKDITISLLYMYQTLI